MEILTLEKRNNDRMLFGKQAHCLAGIGRTECKIMVTFQEQDIQTAVPL